LFHDVEQIRRAGHRRQWDNRLTAAHKAAQGYTSQYKEKNLRKPGRAFFDLTIWKPMPGLRAVWASAFPAPE
jgi:hypothetical protein